MSKSRLINTKFWDDSYITTLDPIEKLLFLYFLTNTSTNICGVYEISLRKAAVETGIEKDMVAKVIKRFSKDKKIFYQKGWICLKNFTKNQNQNSPTVKIGIEREIKAIPSDILEIFIGYGYPIALNLTKLNLTKENTSSKNDDELTTKKIVDKTLGFDKFWSLYPNKVGKSVAMKSWKKISPSEDFVSQIITALQSHLESEAWQKEDGKYIPNPATWINQERWNDELKKKKEIIHSSMVSNKLKL